MWDLPFGTEYVSNFDVTVRMDMMQDRIGPFFDDLEKWMGSEFLMGASSIQDTPH
jgi:hypothetical protein